MSVPPSGGWPPPQQPGQHPNQGQPYGQPGYDPQQPPPGWQQGGWPQQPGPPPQKGNSLKWLLIGVAVLLVIGISVGATLIFTRGSGGGTTTPTSGAPSDFASANDTGPVSIITDEPTCATFVGVNNSLADIQNQGWGTMRKSLGPASDWTPDQRAAVTSVAAAMRNAADRSSNLAKQTPHRVVRELYQQFIASGRAYAEAVASYVPADNGLASANVNASSAIIGICNTITFGSASRGLGVDAERQPTNVSPPSDSDAPQLFIKEPDPICTEWVARLDRFNDATTAWADSDPSIAATEWTPERQTLEASVRPLIAAYANESQSAGENSRNPVLQDFALSSALYLRAFLTVQNSYTGVDGWLSYTGFKFANLISGTCRAVAG